MHVSEGISLMSASVHFLMEKLLFPPHYTMTTVHCKNRTPLFKKHNGKTAFHVQFKLSQFGDIQ